MLARMKPRFTLATLLAIILVFGIGASLAVSVSQSLRKSRVIQCQSHLRVLWQAQFDFAASEANTCCGPMKTHVGGDFWLKLQRGRRAVVDSYDRFYCPLAGEGAVEGRTSYRGPQRNVNKLDDDDVIGADKEGNHGSGLGGNVIFKTGDIVEATETDPLWIRARTTTIE